MLVEINGQLTCCYSCPKIKPRSRFKYLGSLLAILIGIFLLPQVAYFSTIIPEKIIELTNEQRLDVGLNALSVNQTLTQAAYAKGEAIIAAQQFQHNINDKKFSAWIKEAGYKYSYVGENLAIDFMTSEGVINAWLNSETHKENLLNTHYDEIGVAVIEDKFQGQNTILVVQIFGAPPKNIIQPKVLGASNQSQAALLADYSSLNYSFRPENLLIHSIYQNTGSQIPALDGYSTPYPLEKNDFSGVNNFFVHYNLLTAANYANIFISLCFLFLLFYLYFLSFSRLRKSV